MAVKVFCDGCDREMKTGDLPMIRVADKMFSTTHDGPRVDVCKYCVIDAFKKLDDRPQETINPYLTKRPVVLHVDVARYEHETTRLEVFGQSKPGVRMTRDVPSTPRELAVFIAHFAKREGVDYITMDSRSYSAAVLDHLHTLDAPPILTS